MPARPEGDTLLDTVELVRHWRFRAHRVQLAHYGAARSFGALNLGLGIPAIVLSTFVGTSVFATSQHTTSLWIQIAVGLLSVAAAVFASLQTFLKYAETAEKHRVAGARFAHLKHEIELLSAMPPSDEKRLHDALAQIEKRWDRLRRDSPSIPNRLWRQVERGLTFEEHERRFPNFGLRLAPQASGARDH